MALSRLESARCRERAIVHSACSTPRTLAKRITRHEGPRNMTSSRYPARLFDREHPTGTAATVWVTGGGLHVETQGGAEHATWPFETLRLAGRSVRGEPVRLARAGENSETIVAPDAALLAELRRVSPEFAAHAPPPRAGFTSGFALTVIAAALAIAAALYMWGIPALAGVAARQVPVAWERELGDAAHESLAPAPQRIADPRVTVPVDAIVDRLHAASGASYPFRVVIVDRPEVNALAAPGGVIVVFRGLLETSGGPEEVAGVLAHEIQHVLLRHVLRGLLQRASLAVVMSVLAGDASGTLATQLAQGLGDLSYSRAIEEEADAQGYALMRAAAVDPAAMPAFFERLERKQSGPAGLEFLSTHPATEARAKRLRARIAADAPVAARALVTPREWEELMATLKGRSASR